MISATGLRLTRPCASYRGILVAALLAGSVTPAGCRERPDTERHVTVVFRYDDHSERSATDMELKIIDAFRAAGVPVTFGVIPCICAGSSRDPSCPEVIPLGTVKGDILREATRAGIVEVALHGYSHRTAQAGYLAEFSGLDYSAQAETIARGKQILEEVTGTPVTTFVPPWNRYDRNTLRALKALKFSMLSSDTSGVATKDSPLKFLPCTCDLLHVRRALAAARSSRDFQPVIVVLFHAYDFREVDGRRGRITYAEFRGLVEWVGSQRDVRLLTIGQAGATIDDLSAGRLSLNGRVDSMLHLAPSFVATGHRNRYRDDASTLSGVLLCLGLLYGGIVVLSVSGSFALGYRAFGKSALGAIIARYASAALSVVVVACAFHVWQVSSKAAIISVGIISACVGLWLCSLFPRADRLLRGSL